MRIVCYNLHGGVGTDGKRDYKRTARMLEHVKADVALLQEFECRPERGGSEKDLEDLAPSHLSHHIPAPTHEEKDGWYGNLILSRYPPSIKPVIHDLSAGEREPRNLMDVRLEFPGRKIRFFNVHLGLAGGERTYQSRKILEILEKESEMPIIFAGDINEWRPYSPVIRTLDRILGPMPCGATFPSRFPTLRLDRVWGKPDHLIKKAETIRTAETKKISDHLPVLIELR